MNACSAMSRLGLLSGVEGGTDSNRTGGPSQWGSGLSEQLEELVLEPLVGREALEKSGKNRAGRVPVAELEVLGDLLQVAPDADVGDAQALDGPALGGG